MTRTLSSLSLVFIVCGCGLTFDLDPPDPPQQGDVDASHHLDAGGGWRDSGASDASGSMDAEARDASDSRDASGRMDSSTIDASEVADSGLTDAGANLCASAVNGSSCGSTANHRLICVDGACVVGRCGDGFRDADEECDDGNEIPGDGCEPFACVYTCTSHANCADSNPCNGQERCERHLCIAGVPMASDSCPLHDGNTGVCNTTGLCVPMGCGNGVVESGEECDDRNTISNDGCENDCTHTCRRDADCDDGDVCNGLEACNMAQGCFRSSVSVCTVLDACHTASCDSRIGCVTTQIDADGDGHSPRSAGDCGDDCDDTRADVHPGAVEQCGNGRDDDCDTRIDESTVSFECYADSDGDGFGDPTDTVHACMCPAGTLTVAGDCFDVMGDPASALVRPNQPNFFATPYCTPSGDCHYDYDCNGNEELRFTTVFDRCRLLTLSSLCAGTGWRDATPACGATADWVECELGLDLLGALLCRARTTSRTQLCR